MSEYTTIPRHEQLTPSSSQEPLVFDNAPQQAPEFSPEISYSTEDANAVIAEAEAIVRDAYEQNHEKYVFPDDKRGHFEIASHEQRAATQAERSMVDDAWREQIEERRRAAAQEAEARAEERELTASVSADAQAMAATRDYVTQYGMNAE